MNDTKDSMPEMLDPTDVCSAMDDLAFMEYCYSHFDVNHDHKVGLHEARAVREIDLSDSKVVSLRGIEYFTNLERLILDRSTVRELHLLQNTKLKEISAKGCVHLLHTELPNGLSVIPNNEIWYTSTDGKIIEPRNTDAFGANIVSNTYEKGKGIISFDGEVSSIGDYAFSGCTSLTSITIPDSVTEVGWGAFDGCSSLTSVTIPDSVTKIEDCAFEGCTSLTSFYGKYVSEDGRCLIVDGTLNSFAPAGLTEYGIPDSVTSIGKWALYDCTSLTSITIPDSVTSIGDYAFRGCSSLTSITIPDSVTEIGHWAFLDCESLKEIYCQPTTPPECNEAFRDNAKGRKIYVPRQSIEAYKSAEGWKEYANAIVGYDFEAEKKSVAVEQMDKSPYYLFFDTETTGLPRDFNAPASETYNWPRMVQLAWIVANKQGDILKKKSCIIRPEGYTISSSAAEVHGITTAIAQEKGLPLYFVLNVFGEDLAAAKVLVAHNMEFDKKIVHAEYIRLGCEDVWTNGPTKRLCTMMSSVNYCALPGYYDEYKWPKLQELHKKLFGYEFDDAHDALADIEATFKCYWELRKLGLIE